MTKILWLSHLLPYPPKGGALQRSHHLLRGAARVGEVEIVSFRQVAWHRDAAAVEEACSALREVAQVGGVFDLSVDRSPFHRWRLLVSSALTPSPYTVRWNRDRRLRAHLERLSQERSPDLIHFDTIGMLQYRRLFPDAAWVLNHQNVESHMMKRRARQAALGLSAYLRWEAVRLARWERRHGREADLHVVASKLDKERLCELLPGASVAVVENPVDVEYFRPRWGPKIAGSLLFVGRIGAYANADAVRWIRDEIWPRLRAKRSGLSLSVVGHSPPRDIVEWGDLDPCVEVTGFVDDVRQWMDRAEVFLCPVRDGGGTRLKVLDAMAMGLPIVCHPIAAEGIDARHEEHVLMAEDAEGLTRACLRLLEDRDLRERLGRRSRELVESHYSLSTVWRHQADAYQRAIAHRRQSCPSGERA